MGRLKGLVSRLGLYIGILGAVLVAIVVASWSAFSRGKRVGEATGVFDEAKKRIARLRTNKELRDEILR